MPPRLPVHAIRRTSAKGGGRVGRSAAPGDVAEPIVEEVARELRDVYGLHVETGRFGAMMDVELVNDGPFTILVEA